MHTAAVVCCCCSAPAGGAAVCWCRSGCCCTAAGCCPCAVAAAAPTAAAACTAEPAAACIAESAAAAAAGTMSYCSSWPLRVPTTRLRPSGAMAWAKGSGRATKPTMSSRECRAVLAPCDSIRVTCLPHHACTCTCTLPLNLRHACRSASSTTRPPTAPTTHHAGGIGCLHAGQAGLSGHIPQPQVSVSRQGGQQAGSGGACCRQLHHLAGVAAQQLGDLRLRHADDCGRRVGDAWSSAEGWARQCAGGEPPAC